MQFRGDQDGVALFGRGGFGRVTLAVDSLSQANVAIKEQRLPHEAAERELRVLLHLRHWPCPHVVALMDYFVAASGGAGRDHVLRMVFEAFETTLTAYLRSTTVRCGRLERPTALRILAGVTKGPPPAHDPK